MSIDIETFNKLINLEKNMFQKTYEINTSNIVDNYKNLNKDNIYVKKIDILWKKYSKKDTIQLYSKDVSFIETDFNGNYLKYLLFIIPRISKLNDKMLDLFIPKIEKDNSQVDFIDSNDASTEFSEDNDYIQLLEININDLQSKVQNISDILLPKLNKFEEIIKQNEVNVNTSLQDFNLEFENTKLNLNTKLEEFNNVSDNNNSIVNDLSNQVQQFSNYENKINQVLENLQNKVDDIENKLLDHQKYTKNSLIILETRISKILELVSKKME